MNIKELIFKEFIWFVVFMNLFCISFIAFSFVVILTVFFTIPAFLVGGCFVFVVVSAFIFCWNAINCLKHSIKKKPRRKK